MPGRDRRELLSKINDDEKTRGKKFDRVEYELFLPPALSVFFTRRAGVTDQAAGFSSVCTDFLSGGH